MTNNQTSLWGRLKTAARYAFGYDAVKTSRYRKNILGTGLIRSEEFELDPYDRDKMVAALLDMKRNNPIVKSICSLKETDVVGSGILPQATTASETFNDKLADLWEEWADDPTVTGTMTMQGLQQQLASSPLIFGDIGVLKTRSGQLQVFDGSRIGDAPVGFMTSTSPDKNGVIVDKVGRPTHYKIGTRVNGTLSDLKEIPAENFQLFFHRMRPEQWRGVPQLAPCFNSIEDVDEFIQIEMIAAKVAASLSAVVKRSNSVQFEIANREAEEQQDSEGRLEQFEPGAVYYLDPGEDVSTISANGRPNANAIDFLNWRLRAIGAAVGIPYEFLLNDIGKSSFSASQGVVLQYQNALENDQRQISHFMTGIYRWKVAEWVADGRISIPSEVDNPFRVRWQPPRFRWINRAAQVDADIRYLQLGALSLDDVASQFGDTARNIMRQKARNIEQAKQLATEFGLEDWRELFNPYQTFANANFVELLAQSQQLQGQKQNDTTSTESP